MPVEIQKIQQAFKFALDATPRQQRMFSSHAGGARYAYNWGISQTAEALDAYAAEKAAGAEKPTTEIPNHFALCKAWTAYKDDPANELHWVGNNFVGSYQAALRDAAGAWKRFFDSRKGKLKGRRVGRPRFKSKHKAKRAFQVHGSTLQVVDAHHIKMPKVGVVKTHESTRKVLRRILKGTARLVRGTVSQHSDGRWYISLTVELDREIRTGPSARQRAGGTIGIDLGVRDRIVASDGHEYGNPRPLETDLRRLRHAQQALSRTEPGSRRRERARRRVARVHARIGHVRLNASHQLTSLLVHSYAGIGIEGWDVQQTAEHGSKDLPKRVRQNRNRALADSAIGEIRWQLESKARWYGCDVAVADRHQPTGRTCSACGTVRTKPIPPAQEKFTCLSCGLVTDRRVNTARVLATYARAQADAPSGGESKNARGGDVSPSRASGRAGRSPTKREARTQPTGRDQTGTPGP